MRTSITILLLAFLASSGRAVAGTECGGKTTCCDRCGCNAVCVEKACQVVCEMKKEKKTCWQVECQEFGTLMPACPRHKSCGDCCPPPPRCGRCICAKKLVKREYEVEKPVYKCVVLHLCPQCCCGESVDASKAAPKASPTPASPTPTPAAPPAPLPPPPSRPRK
jgi:hypothetical protein